MKKANFVNVNKVSGILFFKNLFRQKISGGNQKEAANQKDLNS